jgi:hypothetical protein
LLMPNIQTHGSEERVTLPRAGKETRVRLPPPPHLIKLCQFHLVSLDLRTFASITSFRTRVSPPLLVPRQQHPSGRKQLSRIRGVQ